MTYITYVRDILVIITTSITLLGVIAKTLNNLFLDCIKNTYMNVPAKQSIFDTVLKAISYIAFVISIFYMFIRLGVTIKYGSIGIIDSTAIPKNMIQFIALIIAVLFVYIIFCNIQIFLNTEQIFKKIIGYKGKYIESRRTNKFNKFFNKHIIGINLINKIISISFAGLGIAGLIYVSISGEIQQVMSIGITILLIGIVGISMFIISNSMTPALRMLKNQDLYYVITKSETIICRFFLEYLDYYLIVNKDCERYISRGEIIEIRKMY